MPVWLVIRAWVSRTYPQSLLDNFHQGFGAFDLPFGEANNMNVFFAIHSDEASISFVKKIICFFTIYFVKGNPGLDESNSTVMSGKLCSLRRKRS